MHSVDFCYICGHHGTTEIAHTRPAGGSQSSSTSKIPCFPSLLLVPPAASSKPASSADGHVRLCLLCFRLLLEQWKSYEKRKTPLANRQYWFKCCAASKDPYDSSNVSRSNANRSNISGGEIDPSRSPSPALPSGQSNGKTSGRSTLDIDSAAVQGLRVGETNRRRTDGTVPTASLADARSGIHSPPNANRPPCVVCSRGIESMDVCRRLPAHLVAQITDLKPIISQEMGQPFSTASLTGEVFVCDDCFAAPSFQNAWLDCCRRGNVPLQSAMDQRGQAERHEQPNPLASEMAAMQSALNSVLPSQQQLTDSQRQWFALYERALLQFHFTGQLDPILVGQLQQLAAAEALASLQHSGGGGGGSTESGVGPRNSMGSSDNPAI